MQQNPLERECQYIANLNVEPLVLCSKDAVIDPTAIGSAVRALCAADIVIADVTNYDPSLLLLLGIRATVRRSVTIVCTEKPLTSELWQELPFNLKELNLVSFSDSDIGNEELRAAIRSGLTQSSISTRYLDLPVYEYIRGEPSNEDTANPPPVLLLRAFTPYTSERKLRVHEGIRKGLGLSEEARVESIIDQTSPRLVGQRLYEAIRYWKTCAVDLTWWRPNVMFELGVRLAVRPSGTFCLIDQKVEGDATFEGAREELKKLLHPISYDLSTPSFFKAIASRSPDQNTIYDIAARHFRTVQDHHSEKVETLLVAAAFLTPGHDDPLQSVDITPLYAVDNRIYGEEIRHSVFEKLCAAWYYLVDREEPHKARPIDLLDRFREETFRRFRSLSSRLKTGLAHRRAQRDERLRLHIENAEKCAKESGAMEMADLLYEWTLLRHNPPWQIDTAKIKEEDLANFIDDCEAQLRQLSTLEAHLVTLASPVCDLPLQGVRSDQRRVKIVLEQFKRRTL